MIVVSNERPERLDPRSSLGHLLRASVHARMDIARRQKSATR